MKATKAITVVYDDAEAQQTAVGFCDGLVTRFWEQFEFEVSWWSLELLENEGCAQTAVKKASLADIVVFATGSCEGVSPGFDQWVERWLREREEHEGTLVGLLPRRAFADFGTSAMSRYLRTIAHRAGMDYLTGIPEGLSQPIPESLESCAERAQQVTTVLDEILHSRLPAAPVPLA